MHGWILLHEKWFNELNVDNLTCPYDSLKLDLTLLYPKRQHDLRMFSMMEYLYHLVKLIESR